MTINEAKTLLPISANDLAALQSLQDALQACNAADAMAFQLQIGGTYGIVHNAFIFSASALFGTNHAERLMALTIECGEDVAYCLDLLRGELCGVCAQRIDCEQHCTECGVCNGEAHSADCSELICLGHETVSGPAGITAYCDGTCCNPLYFSEA